MAVRMSPDNVSRYHTWWVPTWTSEVHSLGIRVFSDCGHDQPDCKRTYLQGLIQKHFVRTGVSGSANVSNGSAHDLASALAVQWKVGLNAYLVTNCVGATDITDVVKAARDIVTVATPSVCLSVSCWWFIDFLLISDIWCTNRKVVSTETDVGLQV
jgi:hypothetical protein